MLSHNNSSSRRDQIKTLKKENKALESKLEIMEDKISLMRNQINSNSINRSLHRAASNNTLQLKDTLISQLQNQIAQLQAEVATLKENSEIKRSLDKAAITTLENNNAKLIKDLVKQDNIIELKSTTIAQLHQSQNISKETIFNISNTMRAISVNAQMTATVLQNALQEEKSVSTYYKNIVQNSGFPIPTAVRKEKRTTATSQSSSSATLFQPAAPTEELSSSVSAFKRIKHSRGL